MTAWYSTRAAARLLGVSEASIRRWSDGGRLPVQRIGRRRSRRFAESDLHRFQAQLAAGAGLDPVPATQPHLAVHDHFATFYDSDAARMHMSLPFLREGLATGQACFLVASKGLADEYLHGLSAEPFVHPMAAISSGQLVIRRGAGSSAPDAIGAWQDLWRTAMRSGATGMRVVGEMATYVGFPAPTEMIAYEVAYDSLCKRFPVTTLCQFDVRHFDGSTILGVLKAHPDLFTRRLGDFLF